MNGFHTNVEKFPEFPSKQPERIARVNETQRLIGQGADGIDPYKILYWRVGTYHYKLFKP